MNFTVICGYKASFTESKFLSYIEGNSTAIKVVLEIGRGGGGVGVLYLSHKCTPLNRDAHQISFHPQGSLYARSILFFTVWNNTLVPWLANKNLPQFLQTYLMFQHRLHTRAE